MERVEGESTAERWQYMSWEKKQRLVGNIVSYLTQLFRRHFKGNGSLYTFQDVAKVATQEKPVAVVVHGPRYCLSDIISTPFFIGDHLDREVPRSVFSSSREWLAARLQLALRDAENRLVDEDNAEESDDREDDINTAKQHIRDTQRLIEMLHKVFPDVEAEEFVLHHHDLNARNILVGDDEEIAGIIDWECIHTSPLWFACTPPRFLTTRIINTCPDNVSYTIKQDNGTEEAEESYWELLEDYEKTKLRGYFFDEMKKICPEWMDVYSEITENGYGAQEWHKMKADFELAIDNWFAADDISLWLDDIDAGDKVHSLAAL